MRHIRIITANVMLLAVVAAAAIVSFAAVYAAIPDTFTGPGTTNVGGQGLFTNDGTLTVSGSGINLAGSVLISDPGLGQVQFDTTVVPGWVTSSSFPNFRKWRLNIASPLAATVRNPATGNVVPVNAGAILRITVYDDPAHVGVQDAALVQMNGTYRDGATTYTFTYSATVKVTP